MVELFISFIFMICKNKHHPNIRSLDKEALANEMYLEQLKNNWPGLARETEDICEYLGIEDVNKTGLKWWSQQLCTRRMKL